MRHSEKVIAARMRYPAGKCINVLEGRREADELIVPCWCERTLGLVAKKDVRTGVTFSCGHWDCRP